MVKVNYKVIEDNAGSLHIYILNSDDKVLYYGLEEDKSKLGLLIKDLENTYIETITDWDDGFMKDFEEEGHSVQEQYKFMTAYENRNNYKTV